MKIKLEIYTFSEKLVKEKEVFINWTNYKQISSFLNKVGSSEISFFEESKKEDLTEIDIELYPEDSFLDFKYKIFAYLGYFPVEQHYIGGEDYVIELNGTYYQPVFRKTEEDVHGIPVDRFFYNSRANVKIINMEHRKILPFLKENNYVLKMVPASNLLKTQFEGYELDLVYWSIVQFYPYFNQDSIKDFIGKKEIFPLLFPSQKSVLASITEQDNVYKEIYEEIEKNPFYDDKILDLMEGHNNKSLKTFISIILLSAYIQQRGKCNLTLLFEIFETSPEIPIISFSTRTIVTTKLHTGYENLYRKHQYSFRNRPDTITFLFEEIVFEINYAGRVAVLAKFSENQRKDFNNVQKSIENTMKKFLKKIDNLDFSVFNGKKVENFYFVREITANLVINKQIKSDMALLTKELTKRGLVKPLSENSFLWLKAVKRKSEEWNEFHGQITSSSKFTIINRTIDTKIEIRGMSDEDFMNFFKYISFFIIKVVETKKEVKELTNNLKSLQSEDPKLYDITSYGSKTVYARLCQSRDKQPLIISEEETKDKNPKSILKFWNYTKEEPNIYYCANKKYAFPYFITDYHPLGYCMVCCKKTDAVSETKQRIHNECLNNHIIKTEKNSEPTRYINIYGKDLEIGRLGHIPDLIAKFILYNIENINIIPEIQTMRTIRYKDNLYSIDKIFKVTENSKVTIVKTKDLLRSLFIPTWKRKRKEKGLIVPMDVIENPEKNRKYNYYYKKIINAKIDSPIYIHSNKENFIVIEGIYRLAKAFVDKIEEIEVKFVTEKQLKRSMIAAYSKEDVSFIDELKESKFGGNDKEPFYYIYSVKKYYKDLNCSLGYCLAAALNIDFEILIKTTISLLEKEDSSSKYLYNLISLVKEDSSQENWNSIFYNICKYYNIIPIIFHDENFSKASTNLVQGEPKFSLLLPGKFSSFDQFHDKKFLLMLRRKSTDISLTGSKYTFYPIFVAIPYAFFKNNMFERQLFEYDDPIIKIIETFLIETVVDVFDLDYIRKFLKTKEKSEITGYFVSEGIMFALQIDEEICFSIKETSSNLTNILNKSKCKTTNLKKFISFIEEYLYFRNIGISITTLYKYKNKFIGVKINGKTFYIEENNVPKEWIEECEIIELNYHPIEIIYKKQSFQSKLEKKWTELSLKRNNYSCFKEKFFRKVKESQLKEIVEVCDDLNKSSKLISKIMKSDFADDLALEFRDPVKRNLFLENSFIFENLYFTQSKKETIYIKHITF